MRSIQTRALLSMAEQVAELTACSRAADANEGGGDEAAGAHVVPRGTR